MQKKWILVLNTVILIIVVSLLVFFVWKFSISEEVIVDVECVEVHRIANFHYNVCYDDSSKSILVELKRGFDNYRLRNIRFSFFDYSDKIFEVIDVPNTNESRAFNIHSEKNPGNLDVRLGIQKDFSAPICEEPKRVFVRDCPFKIQSDFLNVSMIPFDGLPLSNYTSIGKPEKPSSDILSPDLVEKERIWKSICESRWECDDWETCVDDIEKRECKDLNNCFVPTAYPETMRYCDGRCIENWVCEWGECREGYTVPNCRDLNNCGTSHNIPQRLECGATRICRPDVSCGVWSECEVEYNFIDLISSDLKNLQGVMTRTCVDQNACIPKVDERRNCTSRVDIYTRTFNKCGIEYLGLYNRLNNELIVRIDKNTGVEPHLNIYLDDKEESPYCDYCFNGVQDGDETGIDCGGSCMPCEEKYPRTSYRRENALTRFWDWLKDFFR